MSNLMPVRDDDVIESRIAKFFTPHVREKYQHLVEIDTARDGLHAANQAKINAEREKVRELQADLHWAERQIREGAQHTSEDQAAISKTKTKIAKMQRRIAEMVETSKLPPNLPLEPITRFILEAKRPFTDARVEVKLKSGENPRKALEEARGNHVALIEQRNEIEKTLLPLERAVARAVADIEQAAARGKPKFEPCTRLVRTDAGWTDEVRLEQGLLEFPTEPFETGARTVEIGDGVGLVAWLMKDQLVARVRNELTALYKGKESMPLADREARLGEIDAAIFNEELREEAFVELCEQAGLTVYRRPRANIAAILGVAKKV
jgi:hypothetical protein